ncbi:MAG: hypothetical protein OEV91_02590 [Desulfobulbaceae bacterium]|nr:hypothetical protein [Desulfobulbaceae bacterium]
MTQSFPKNDPDAAFHLIFAKIKQARKTITDKHGTTMPKADIRDSVDCPCCETGKLFYSISSYNGHIHAACDTGKCVSWME